MPDPISRSTIYVIGHRNPDTDAICSAIGNAEFLKIVEKEDAVAARCGDVPQRTAWVLELAGVEEPKLLHDVTPTAGFMCRQDVVTVNSDDTFMSAYKKMTEHSVQSIPVVDSQKSLKGLLRYVDLLKILMPMEMTEKSVRTVDASLDRKSVV